MTWNFNWNVIVDIADNMFIIMPISLDYLISLSNTVGVISVLL